MNKLIIEEHELPYQVSEQIKTLRTNLMLSGESMHYFMVTSCLANEGKSSICYELTRSFADLGKSAVYIDTDLRKSVFHRRVEEGKIVNGLTNFLAGQCGTEDILYDTQDRNVAVIPAGPVPPNPSELLASGRFTALMNALKKVFDYIVIDTSPLGMVIDSAIVAPSCDGSILIIEAGTISYRLAQEVKIRLEKTGIPLLGVVLNKVDRKEGSRYYKYGTGKYYDKRYYDYYY